MELTLMKGGTSHRIRSYDTGWWGREVGTMGGGDDGKWWGGEVVTKGSGDEGEWWGREVGTKEVVTEVVRKGSGYEGKWSWRGVVRKGGGDDGKWWGREVVTKGSGEEGSGDRREVVTMGSGDVVLEAVCVEAVCVVLCVSWICGCTSHWNGCMNVAWALFWGGSRSTKPVFFRVKWLQAAMKVPRVCGECGCGRLVLLCVLQHWLFLCA